QFHLFHQNYYHPSNARLYMYGDDDPAERLRLLSIWLDAFERCEPDSSVALQTPFVEPQRFTRPYPAGDSAAARPKAMLTVNWLLPETCDTNANMALCILEYILLGMPASPLKKALIDSGLGDGLAGVGLENELRQLYFSTGLKGIKPEAADKVEALIIETLTRLANEGIDSRTKEAAFNTIEFRLRENNTGHFPRGLIIMLRSLTTWLYDNDPFSMMAFDAPLAAVKKAAGQQTRFFEDLIERHFLKNRHRSTLLLRPDKDLAARQADDERQRLSRETGSLSPAEQQQIQDNTRELKKLQQAPDPAEALASIPRLGLDDLDKHNTPLPLETSQHSRAEILYHDLFTSDIIYLDIGLNLHLLPTEQLPYAPLLGRVLLESGTEQEDFVTLSQRISRTTGGISSSLFTSAAHGSDRTAAWLFLRGKAMARQGQEMLDIIADVLQSARLDDRQRFKQILLQEKAAQEQRLIPRGHQLTRLRLMAHFHEAAAADEATSGISYLLFLRELEHAIEHDWDRIQKTLESMRRLLVNRAHMIVNITTDEKNRDSFCPGLHSFIDRLPAATASIPDWSFAPLAQNEGLTVPSTVNYVGKAADIYDLGYTYNGSINVITHFIRNTWLWEQVRVLGGAYGGF
ncbi:MAG: peptidase M16, partial [Deltaproteobacteria bacterium]|nr:peptidase M16 [Deltaproteobacteria bacterium]